MQSIYYVRCRNVLSFPSRRSADLLFGKLNRQPFGGQQGLVLLGQRRGGLGENAHEVLDPQRIQLHANGQPALEFGDEVGGRSEENTSELQSRGKLVCRLLPEK